MHSSKASQASYRLNQYLSNLEAKTWTEQNISTELNLGEVFLCIQPRFGLLKQALESTLLSYTNVLTLTMKRIARPLATI